MKSLDEIVELASAGNARLRVNTAELARGQRHRAGLLAPLQTSACLATEPNNPTTPPVQKPSERRSE